jgi:hyperosmotically inducible protein
MRTQMLVGIAGLALVIGAAAPAHAVQDTAKDKTVAAAQDVKAKTEEAASKTARVLTDTEITAAVKTKFVADPKVSALNISVETTRGVVTLTGTVSGATERTQALHLARTTHGVRRVVNKLTLDKKTR